MQNYMYYNVSWYKIMYMYMYVCHPHVWYRIEHFPNSGKFSSIFTEHVNDRLGNIVDVRCKQLCPPHGHEENTEINSTIIALCTNSFPFN